MIKKEPPKRSKKLVKQETMDSTFLETIKKNKPFKDQDKIVTEEFDPDVNVVTEGSILLNPASRDLEYLQQYTVAKAKPGFTAWPNSNLRKSLPSGLVIEPY